MIGQHLTKAGGGTEDLMIGATYRMRCGEAVTITGRHGTNQAGFCLTDGRRLWLVSGHFIGVNTIDDRDLVERISGGKA